MLASHLYPKWNFPTWHQCHRVPPRREDLLPAALCSALIGGCLEAEALDSVLGLYCKGDNELSSHFLEGTVCAFNKGWSSSSEYGDDRGGVGMLHRWCVQNNWWAEINLSVYFLLVLLPLRKGRSPRCLWEDEPKREAREMGIYRAHWFFSVKFKKQRPGENGIRQALFSDKRSPTVWTIFTIIYLKKCILSNPITFAPP